jgi:hypothetical protein
MSSAIQETVAWESIFDGRLDKPIDIKDLKALLNGISDSENRQELTTSCIEDIHINNIVPKKMVFGTSDYN